MSIKRKVSQIGESDEFASGLSSEKIERNILDLPVELITMVFMEVDSIARKQAQRVCKVWFGILTGTKKFCTDVRIDVLSEHLDTPWGVYTILEQLVTPDLETLYINGSNTLEKRWDDTKNCLEFEYIHHVLEKKKIAPRKVKIAVSRCEFTWRLTDDNLVSMDIFKEISMHRTKITPIFVLQNDHVKRMWCCEVEGVVFDQLKFRLSPTEKFNKQMADALLGDSGPLTHAQTGMLRQAREKLPPIIVECLTDVLNTYGFDVDLDVLLNEVTNGRCIPKIYADTLVRFTREALEHDEEDE